MKVNSLQSATNRWWNVNEVAVISMGSSMPSPAGLLFDGRYLWVSGDGLLQRVDPVSCEPVGSPINVGSAPVSMCMDGLRLYVANLSTDNVSVIELATASVLDVITVGDQPEGPVFTGRYVWVANQGDSTLSKIDPLTLTVVDTVTGHIGVCWVAFDGTHLLTANFAEDSVSKLDPETGAEIALYLGVRRPACLLVDPDGEHLWISSGGSKLLTRMRISDGEMTNSFYVGEALRGLACDGRYLWAASSVNDQVAKIDTVELRTVGVYTVGAGARGMACDGINGWVAESSNGTIRKL